MLVCLTLIGFGGNKGKAGIRELKKQVAASVIASQIFLSLDGWLLHDSDKCLAFLPALLGLIGLDLHG